MKLRNNVKRMYYHQVIVVALVLQYLQFCMSAILRKAQLTLRKHSIFNSKLCFLETKTMELNYLKVNLN